MLVIVQQTDVGKIGLSELFGQLALQKLTPQNLALPIVKMTKVAGEKKKN